MSSTVLSDDTLFNGGNVDKEIIKDYYCLKTMVSSYDENEEIDSADINEFFNERDANTITYLFRLSLLTVGYNGLSKISRVILNHNKDHVNEYLFRSGDKLVPYYRYFANAGDYNAIATIFEKRGIDGSWLSDFKSFINEIGFDNQNKLLNEMPDGDYEKLFALAHN